MVCEPVASEDVVTEAVPDPESVCGEPKLTPPSLNCTVPVGVAPAPVTPTLKVTDWPKVEVAGPVTAVVLGRLTTSVAVAVFRSPLLQSFPAPPVPVARTVKVVVPVGVAAVVFTVSSENILPVDVPVSELGA